MRLLRLNLIWIAATLAAALLAACGPAPRTVATAATPVAAPASYEIEGRVTLHAQADSSGIHVFIPGSSIMAMTDARGYFKLEGIKAGIYSIRAEHTGYTTTSIGDVEIPAGASDVKYVLGDTELTGAVATPLTVAQLGSINGRLLAPADLPEEQRPALSDARVELAGTAMRTFTDLDGAFFLWNIEPGSYSLRVRAAGYLDYAATIEVFAGKDPTRLNVTLTLAPPPENAVGTITGQVEMLAEDGSELNDFDAVSVYLRELPARRVQLDAEGTFHIDHLAPGVYTVLAEADGFTLAAPVTADLSNQDEVDVALTLNAAEPKEEKPGRLEGMVIKSDAPAGGNAGISVALAGTSHTATTDGEGHWRMSGVEPGTFEIIAQAEGYTPAMEDGIEVESGQQRSVATITLERELDYPTVIETNPGNNSKDFAISREMVLTVRFSKKMKPEELKRAVAITPDVEWRAFAGREHKLSDFDLLVIVFNGASLEKPMPFNTQIKVMIDTGAVDVQGVPLREPFNMSLRTGAAAVIATDPPQGAKDVVLMPSHPMVFIFNTQLKPGTIDARDIKFRPSMSATPTVQMMDDPITGWTSVYIQSVWRPNANYEVTLPKRIKTVSGQSVSNLPYTLKFKTADVVPFSGFQKPGR